MKSLSENYTESHGNTHETFADLVFCALVVLILFVLALTVEVSQRVRSVAEVKEVDEVKAEDVVKLSPQEMEQLSAKLQSQQAELKELRQKLIDNQSEVQNRMAALAGEQRFTGVREPASLTMAYDYRKQLFYFVPAKDVDDADRARSGETSLESLTRKQITLRRVAEAARERQRGYTLAEAQAIYSAMTQYKMIEPNAASYTVTTESVGISYHVLLCEYISDGASTTVDREAEVVDAILKVYTNKGPERDDMYPSCRLEIDDLRQKINIGGVSMSARNLRDTLLSISGRGLLLDMEGYQGSVPKWLYEGALVPAGYVSKTPKAVP